jgi:hypothetical protein
MPAYRPLTGLPLSGAPEAGAVVAGAVVAGAVDGPSAGGGPTICTALPSGLYSGAA